MAQANGSTGSDTALDSNASPSSKHSAADLRAGENSIAAAANPSDDLHEKTSDSKLEKSQDAPEEKRTVTGFKVCKQV